MIELYRNSANRIVTLNVPLTPVSGTVEVTVSDETGVLYEVPSVTVDPVNGEFSFSMPYFLTQYDRELDVEWKFDYVENTIVYPFSAITPVCVITPILTVQEVQAVAPSLSETEAIDIEKMVRHIIYAHTGQIFGLYIGKKTVIGKGSYTVELPARLLDINKVNGLVVNSSMYKISGSGWYLTVPDFGIPGIKADYYGLHYINGVVENPNGVSLANFSKGVEYIVEGRWGWASIPEPIKEAAKLLVNDYACQDNAYRDRYLESVQATDWRIQFSAGAYVQTGNVRADQLLSNFVLKRGWSVV